jgi:hypothetical protein
MWLDFGVVEVGLVEGGETNIAIQALAAFPKARGPTAPVREEGREGGREGEREAGRKRRREKGRKGEREKRKGGDMCEHVPPLRVVLDLLIRRPLLLVVVIGVVGGSLRLGGHSVMHLRVIGPFPWHGVASSHVRNRLAVMHRAAWHSGGDDPCLSQQFNIHQTSGGLFHEKNFLQPDPPVHHAPGILLVPINGRVFGAAPVAQRTPRRLCRVAEIASEVATGWDSPPIGRVLPPWVPGRHGGKAGWKEEKKEDE